MSNYDEFDFDVMNEDFNKEPLYVKTGTYIAHIQKCTLQPTKKAEDPKMYPEHKDSKNLYIEFRIVKDLKNNQSTQVSKVSKIWLNVNNSPSKNAELYSRKILSDIAIACKLSHLKKATDLLNKYLKIEIEEKEKTIPIFDDPEKKFKTINTSEIIKYESIDAELINELKEKAQTEFNDEIPFI